MADKLKPNTRNQYKNLGNSITDPNKKKKFDETYNKINEIYKNDATKRGEIQSRFDTLLEKRKTSGGGSVVGGGTQNTTKFSNPQPRQDGLVSVTPNGTPGIQPTNKVSTTIPQTTRQDGLVSTTPNGQVAQPIQTTTQTTPGQIPNLKPIKNTGQSNYPGIPGQKTNPLVEAQKPMTEQINNYTQAQNGQVQQTGTTPGTTPATTTPGVATGGESTRNYGGQTTSIAGTEGTQATQTGQVGTGQESVVGKEPIVGQDTGPKTMIIDGVEISLKQDNSINDNPENIQLFMEKSKLDENSVRLALYETNDKIRQGKIASDIEAKKVLSDVLEQRKAESDTIKKFVNGEELVAEGNDIRTRMLDLENMKATGYDKNGNPLTEDQYKQAVVRLEETKQEYQKFQDTLGDRAILSEEGKDKIGVNAAEDMIKDIETKKQRAIEDKNTAIARLNKSFDDGVNDLKKYHGLWQTSGATHIVDGITRAQADYKQKLEDINYKYETNIEDINTNITRTVEDVDKQIKTAKDNLDKDLERIKTESLYNIIVSQETYGTSSEMLTGKLQAIQANKINGTYGAISGFFDTIMKGTEMLNKAEKEALEIKTQQQTISKNEINNLMAEDGRLLKGESLSTLKDRFAEGFISKSDYNTLVGGMVSVGGEMLAEYGNYTASDLDLYKNLLNKDYSPTEAVAEVVAKSGGRLYKMSETQLAQQKNQIEIDKFKADMTFKYDQLKSDEQIKLLDIKAKEEVAAKEEADKNKVDESLFGLSSILNNKNLDNKQKGTLLFNDYENLNYLDQIRNTPANYRTPEEKMALAKADKILGDIGKEYGLEPLGKKSTDIKNEEGFIVSSGNKTIPYNDKDFLKITQDGKLVALYNQATPERVKIKQNVAEMSKNKSSLKTLLGDNVGIIKAKNDLDNLVKEYNLGEDYYNSIQGLYNEELNNMKAGLGDYKDLPNDSRISLFANKIKDFYIGEDLLTKINSNLTKEQISKLTTAHNNLNTSLTSATSFVVRAVLDEVGVLTNQDIDRAKSLLGNLLIGDSIEENINKLNEVSNINYQMVLKLAANNGVDINAYIDDIDYNLTHNDENGETKPIWTKKDGTLNYREHPFYVKGDNIIDKPGTEKNIVSGVLSNFNKNTGQNKTNSLFGTGGLKDKLNNNTKITDSDFLSNLNKNITTGGGMKDKPDIYFDNISKLNSMINNTPKGNTKQKELIDIKNKYIQAQKIRQTYK